jgi:hypothetical protein
MSTSNPDASRESDSGAAETGRGRGIGAAIVGFFAISWFAWGSAEPTSTALTALIRIGTAVGLLVICLGVTLAVRSPAGSSLMADPVARRRYGIIVGSEFALLGLGSAVMGVLGLAEWIPVWICFGVGVHFFPLAPVIADRGAVVLGALLIAVSGVALVVGLTTDVAPATVAGLGAGVCLLIWAVSALLDRSLYPGRSVA